MTVSSTGYGCGIVVVTADHHDADRFVEAIAHACEDAGSDLVLVFFSLKLFDPGELVDAFARIAPGLRYAGCSTSGEIAPQGLTERSGIAVVFPRGRFRADATMVSQVSSSGLDSVTIEVERLKNNVDPRALAEGRVFAVSLIDGLSFAEEAVTSAIHWALDDIPLVGGSAGDDLRFTGTVLIADGRIESDCAIVALVESAIPFQVFKTDNFVATDDKLVVTEADPDRRIVFEFNADPAASVYAEAVGLLPGDLSAMSFASYPVVLKVGGEYYSRSIQRANEDGSLSFFCAVDDGIVLTMARATGLVESTRNAFDEIRRALDGIDLIIGFDCVLRHIDAQNRQVTLEMSELYSENHVVGFGTYGEQYRSMHLNQTFTGIAFGRPPPE